MSDLMELGRKIFNDQPFSHQVGGEILRFETGVCEFALDLEKHHQQQHGFTHGGVLAYLADSALTFAGGSVLGDVLTLEFKINYLRPGVGERLIARARVLSQGKRQAVVRCDIFAVNGGEEKLCAAAQGTIAKRG